MPYMCKNCGGDLKADGKGFKCTCCGAKYASEAELGPQIKAEPILKVSEPSKPAKEAPKKENEKKGGLFSKFNVGKKKDDQPNNESDDNSIDYIKGTMEQVIGGGFKPPKKKEEMPKVEEPQVETKSNQGVNVFDDNINGVLEITWHDDQYIHSGSGFLVSDKGYAITNTHVVTHEDGRTCGTVDVRICGENVRADVIKLGDNLHGHGTGVDLAIIKLNRVPKNAKVVEIEDFDNVRIGEQVFVIGNSLGLGTCITSGIVSDKLRNVNGKMLMMTDCAVNGGNSGGPIFNAQGKVIGAIVAGIDSAEGMNFAIPSSTVVDFMNSDSSLFKLMGAQCSNCHSNSTNTENGIVHCNRCPNEWGDDSKPTFGMKK